MASLKNSATIFIKFISLSVAKVSVLTNRHILNAGKLPLKKKFTLLGELLSKAFLNNYFLKRW